MEELRRREEFADELGGPERVERQHAGGRYTVRERIAKLADPGSFHEVGKIAGSAHYDARNDLKKLVPSNFVFGRARLDGRPVVVGGDDFTVRGGSADATIQGKHRQCEQMAHEFRLPLIRLVEGSGGCGSVKTIETTGRANVPGVSGWEWVVDNIGTIPRVAPPDHLPKARPIPPLRRDGASATAEDRGSLRDDPPLAVARGRAVLQHEVVGPGSQPLESDARRLPGRDHTLDPQ